jgi:hypothetical protein
VSLTPKNGTQGREMDRKMRIAAILGLALVLTGAAFASVPAMALAGSPLLSGYGGPGEGEQAILGSTLLNVPGGGSGSGGSSGSSGSSGSGASGGSGRGEGVGATPSTGSTGGSVASSRGGAGASGTTSSAGAASARRVGVPIGASQAKQTDGERVHGAGTSAYVYPSTLRVASDDSSVLGISNDDLVLLAVTIATLALLGVLTIRLGRLQS